MHNVKNKINQLLFPLGLYNKDYFPVESRCLIAQEQKQGNTRLLYLSQLCVLHAQAAVSQLQLQTGSVHKVTVSAATPSKNPIQLVQWGNREGSAILAIIINTCTEWVEVSLVWSRRFSLYCTIQWPQGTMQRNFLKPLSYPTIAPWVFGCTAWRLGLCTQPGVHFSSLKLFHQQEFPSGLQDRGAALPNSQGVLEQRKEKALLWDE